MPRSNDPFAPSSTTSTRGAKGSVSTAVTKIACGRVWGSATRLNGLARIETHRPDSTSRSRTSLPRSPLGSCPENELKLTASAPRPSSSALLSSMTIDRKLRRSPR